MSRSNRAFHKRLTTVETKRDSRNLVHTYRLADGRTARLGTRDVLAVTMSALHLHGQVPPEPPPTVRTLAQLDPADTSLMGSLTRTTAAEWCRAHDEQRPADMGMSDDPQPHAYDPDADTP
jgi:hypothetical protein